MRIRRTKPSPDPYLAALARINVAGFAASLSQTVAIDDTRRGLVTVRTARAQYVGVADARKAVEPAPHTELVISGFDGLRLDMLVTLVNRET
jgi:beta-phosphoglucomutase-like phosphatase (HAD superfamily)